MGTAPRPLRCSTHTVTAEILVSFPLPGFKGPAYAIAVVDVTYQCAAGDAGSPPDICLLAATLVNFAGLEPSDAEVTRWAQAWLDDVGYAAACDRAEALAA